MNYVPNLIPEHSRVNIQDVNSSLSETVNPTTTWTAISYLGSTIFLVGAIGTIFFRFWEGILLLTIALVLLPQGHRWIEKTLRFKFTWLIKAIFIALIISVLIPISQNYTRYYNQVEAENKAKEERVAEEERQKRILSEKKEKERIDSLNYYSTKAEETIKIKHFRTAIKHLNAALRFSGTQNDLVQKRAQCYVNSNQIPKAITDYSDLIRYSHNATDNYYNRALCYIKLKKKAEAVSDLKQAIAMGNSVANKLHERINPVKRRVAYYVTRCCDGTTSNSTGRGTCSHHGGVCNWKDPVYEQYRDY